MKTISERALDIASARPDARELGYYSVGAPDLAQALDEWQASVEERLAKAEDPTGFNCFACPRPAHHMFDGLRMCHGHYATLSDIGRSFRRNDDPDPSEPEQR